MDLPSFDGSDVLSWIARANQYFLVHNTPVERRVQVALVALTGPAMSWVQILLRRSPLITWDDFAGELQARFGTSSALNSYEALRTVSQIGTLDEYIAAFEGWLAQLPELTDQQALGFFLGGLKSGIRAQIRDPNLTSYADALKMAKRIEFFDTPTPMYGSRVSNLQQPRPPPSGRQTVPLTPRPFQQPTGGGMAPRNPRPFRSISNEEFRKHVAAGTCFKCGLRFGPMHRCPPKTLQVLVGEDEIELEEEFHDAMGEEGSDAKELEPTIQRMELSEMTSNGIDGFQTLKLIGHVGQHQVKIMIDSGASHCFITETAARRLGLEVVATDTFAVTLGDGTKVRAEGVCMGVPLRLSSHNFIVTCHLFSLSNIDVILGISWLAQL